ncbi:hypothetical protein IEQ34_019299 [Dendrobium chrysotoxum]|uniref:Ubiquitin-like protease family profile domain-containing protein n=1 Tax=Dendrobium chrysotoxum TaxID=161865 RepID=A0AAV7G8B1_DENCH|nr:hypothetical protein IEQ34_019299 [Dendrobium chrysotoxum]
MWKSGGGRRQVEPKSGGSRRLGRSLAASRAEVRWWSAAGWKSGGGRRPGGGPTKVGLKSDGGRRPGGSPAAGRGPTKVELTSSGGWWPGRSPAAIGGRAVVRRRSGLSSAAWRWSDEGRAKVRRRSAAGWKSGSSRRLKLSPIFNLRDDPIFTSGNIVITRADIDQLVTNDYLDNKHVDAFALLLSEKKKLITNKFQPYLYISPMHRPANLFVQHINEKSVKVSNLLILPIIYNKHWTLLINGIYDDIKENFESTITT